MRTTIRIAFMILAFAAARGACAQASPRWFGEVSVGTNSINGMGAFGRSGADAAVGVGVRGRRPAPLTWIALASAHAARPSNEYTFTCPDIPGYVCRPPEGVLPFVDVLAGVELSSRHAALRVMGGAGVHRTSGSDTDYLLGPQFRADLVAPGRSRIAGVFSFRYTRIRYVGSPIFVQGFAAGLRVQ